MITSYPTVLASVRAEREFLGRAVSYLVGEAGIWQFLDIGTGLPSAGNTHEASQVPIRADVRAGECTCTMRVRFIAVWSRIAIGRIRSFQKGTRDVATIRKWTGRESRALREAMRLSIRDFADQLGVTARSISKWEAGGPHFVQRPESQEILDTKLRQVSDEVRARLS